jgi:archaellum component FlaF (FlaF/FlaG flagellin family)
MKTIFYILSILVIGAAAYFSWDNSNKIQGEIDLFESTRAVKTTTEASIKKQEGILKNTKEELDTAQNLNAELIQGMENMKSRENSYNKAKEAEQVKIDEADARLGQLAEIKAKIDKALEGVDIAWPQIPSEIKRLQELRKKKGDDLDLLNEHIAKLTKDVADKRASNARESDRLSKIRTKIARNAKVGAITSVNSTWGFVIVNLGTNNSNVTAQSKLLVTRNGRLLGRLTPNSVEASQTVCDLNARDVNPGVRIQPGDQVTLADSSAGQ